MYLEAKNGPIDLIDEDYREGEATRMGLEKNKLEWLLQDHSEDIEQNKEQEDNDGSEGKDRWNMNPNEDPRVSKFYISGE